jgi:hypothetical protein
MKKSRKKLSSLLVGAAFAGMFTGIGTLPSCGGADAKAQHNGCNGPNGCKGHATDKKEANGCNGPNGCKGHATDKKEANGCNGPNGCKGHATDKKECVPARARTTRSLRRQLLPSCSRGCAWPS